MASTLQNANDQHIGKVRYWLLAMFITQALTAKHSPLIQINDVSADADLVKFSREFGVDMPMILPDDNGNWKLEGTNEVYKPATVAATTSTATGPKSNNLTVPGAGPDVVRMGA